MMTRKLAALMRMMIWSKVIVMVGVCCWGQKQLLAIFPQQGLELRYCTWGSEPVLHSMALHCFLHGMAFSAGKRVEMRQRARHTYLGIWMHW
jgi:hypothetical protein